MIKILIADDHAIVRKGLKQIVSETRDMVVAGEAASGHEAVEKCWKEDFDVVLLDIAMPGRDGLDALKQIKRSKPHLSVLMLSVYPEEQYAVRALRDGASGYLVKESAPEELVAAVRKVAKGGKYVSASLAERLAVMIEKEEERPLHEMLSDRELQVLCMIASGKGTSEMAEEISLSVKTISTYRSRILDKMGMQSNAELIHYAIQSGLVDCIPPPE